MKEYKYKNKEWLKEQVNKYKSLSELSKNTGYPTTSLKRWCDKFEIKLETKRKSTSRVTKDFLIEQYSLGKEIREIAKEFGLSTQTIVSKNKEFGLSATDYNPRYIYNNKEWLEEQFDIYSTVSEIATRTGYPRTCITRSAQKFGLYEKQYTREKFNYIEEDYFKIIDTPDKAYFLGLIMADGNIYEYNDGKLQFSLKLKRTDSDIIYKLADAIKFNKDRIRISESLRNGTVCEFTEIKSYNTTFCNNLMNLGIIPRKGGSESIPNEVPLNFIKDFIRGYIDGDGWILPYDKYSQIGVCSESIKLINDIIKYFSRVINITTSVTKDKTLYRFSVTKKDDVPKLCDHLYYEGCIALNRKYNNARKIVHEYLK